MAVTRETETSDPLLAAQVDALNRQAWELRADDTQQAIELGEQARVTAEQHGYRHGLARSLFILGHCHYRIAGYELARAQLLAASALFEALGDQEGRADALNTIGNVYSGLGDHHSALDYYLQSLAIRQAIGNRQAEAASLNNIGNVYFHLNDFSNALESHLRSLAIKEALGDRLAVAYSLHNIANVYEVLDNLINNAIKYSPQARAIWVGVTRKEAHIRLTVRDQGPGLTAEDQQRLFGKFERLSARPTGGESATGLGLAIVKLLVDLHGGSVWAESDGLRNGSMFIVELPAAPPD